MSVKHYDWVAHHANMRGDKVAIVDLDTGTELTYAELDQRAANSPLGCKVRVWQRATGRHLAPNCPEFLRRFRLRKIGAICLPLNWRLTVPELEYILKDSSPKLLISDVSLLAKPTS